MIGLLALVTKNNGGIFQYAISMAQALSLHGEKSNYRVFRTPEFPSGLMDQEKEVPDFTVNVAVKALRYVYLHTGIRLGNLAGFLPSESYKDIDLFVSPMTTCLPAYLDRPYVVTIHDLQHKYYPQFFSLRERLKRDYLYKNTAQKARAILCESQFVKRDICAYLNVPEEKVAVIPSPPPVSIIHSDVTEDQMKQTKLRYQLPTRYLFYPAQFWPHKNHIRLIQALYLIKQNTGTDIPLILIGSKQNYFSQVETEIQKAGLGKQIRYLGYVPDSDIPCLYTLSTGLVMPTLFESVSMPIWEAMHLGVPIVSSTACSLPEQLGEEGLYFDPLNVDDMAEKISLFWTSEALRTELALISKERIATMTLENYARKLEHIFQKVLCF
ncbi:MAG: glycosyltransferase family 1 protein [Phycisphaerae bacterium]